MTRDQINNVLKRVQSWPTQRQEDAARVLLAMEAEGTTPYVLSADEDADLRAALDEIGQGDIATDAEVEAVFARRRA